MTGFHAGEALRQSQQSFLDKLNPFYKPAPLHMLTLGEVQTDEYWSLIVEEIVRSTDNLILEGQERRRVRDTLGAVLFPNDSTTPTGLESIFIASDYESGDLEAIMDIFSKPKRTWDMRKVALAMIVIYVGIMRKSEAAKNSSDGIASLTTGAIELQLYIDRSAIRMAKRMQRERTRKLTGAVLAAVVILHAMPDLA